MIKSITKYGWKHFLMRLCIFFVGMSWWNGFFYCYMNKNETDEEKRALLDYLHLISRDWLILQIIAFIAKIVIDLYT